MDPHTAPPIWENTISGNMLEKLFYLGSTFVPFHPHFLYFPDMWLYVQFGNQQFGRLLKIWETPARDYFLFVGCVIQCSSCQEFTLNLSDKLQIFFLDKRSLTVPIHVWEMFYLVSYTYRVGWGNVGLN